MKNAFLLIFLSFIILGISLSPMGILAEEGSSSDDSSSSDDEDKSGSRSSFKEEIKKEFRTDDGRRVKIERKVEIKDGKIKVRIKRKVIDAEGNEIEFRIIIEKDKDGIKKKIKIEGVEGLEVNTELEIDDEFEGNESELVAIMSNGKRAKIKIMPDQIVEIALERLKAQNFTIELKEVRSKNQLRAIYNIEANKTGRFLGIVKLKIKLEGQIDPETGEFIRINKPWWAFLVTGEEGDQVGKKTTLCHIPPGNPEARHTISVGAPAVAVHLGRHGGDTLGACTGGGNGNETAPPAEESTFPQWFDSSTDGTTAGTLIEHKVRWTDDANLSGFIFSFDNGTGTFVDDSFVEMTGTNNFSIVSKVVNSTVGTTIRWKISANDTSNNLNVTDIFSYNTTSVSDTTAPTINYVSPTENSGVLKSQNYILINVTAEDLNLDEILIRLYNSSNDLINSSTTSSSPNYVNFSGLSDGLYYYNATANDTFGNENFLVTRNITLDTTT